MFFQFFDCKMQLKLFENPAIMISSRVLLASQRLGQRTYGVQYDNMVSLGLGAPACFLRCLRPGPRCFKILCASCDGDVVPYLCRT